MIEITIDTSALADREAASFGQKLSMRTLKLFPIGIVFDDRTLWASARNRTVRNPTKLEGFLTASKSPFTDVTND